MKRGATIFLQAVIMFSGVFAFVFMLWEPHLEGRNLHATLFEIYFKDLFLICAYIAAVPFFMALYQAFKFLEYIRQNKASSSDSLKAIKIMKYCAIFLVGVLAVAEAYLFIVRPDDDIAGGVFMGILIGFFSVAGAIVAAFLEKKYKIP